MNILTLLLLVLTIDDIQKEVAKLVDPESEVKILGIHILGISNSNNLSQFDKVEIMPKDNKKLGRRVFSSLFLKKDCSEEAPNSCVKRGTVFAYIEKYKEVAVANRDILKDEVLTPDSITIQSKQLSLIPQDALSYSEAISKIVKAAVKEGDVIRAGLISEDFAIKKGDRITAYIKSGNIYIEVLALALESGKIGQKIRMRNMSSNRIIWGYVQDKRRVEIR